MKYYIESSFYNHCEDLCKFDTMYTACISCFEYSQGLFSVELNRSIIPSHYVSNHTMILPEYTLVVYTSICISMFCCILLYIVWID
jgi:hypothetical protein